MYWLSFEDIIINFFKWKIITKHWRPERLSSYAILVAVLARVDIIKKNNI